MSKSKERTIADMDIVLEETCRVFPNGGDHERRKYIAQKLKDCADNGSTTLGQLRIIAHGALEEITSRPSA
jgi:hypothetical protein